MFLLLVAASAVLNRGPAAHLTAQLSSVLHEGIGVLSVLAAMWIMSRIETHPLSSFGLARPDAGRNFAAGLVAGFLALSILMGALVLTHAYRFKAPNLHGGEIVIWALIMGGGFLLVGAFEELLTRGYPLFALAQGMGFWPAAILLSLIFGAGHLGNRGEEILGVANAMVAGLVFAYTLRWSGSLWWAIGCHASWDWGESFFYGVADSGGTTPHHWLSGQPIGPGWLSGGTVGPEGSALCLAAFLVLIAMVRLSTRPRKAPGLDRLRRPEPLPVPTAGEMNC